MWIPHLIDESLALFPARQLLIQLLNRYARTDSQSRDGMTALMLASANGHAECVGLLLLSGANTSQTDSRGRTALKHALLRRHTRVALTLAEWDRRLRDGIVLPKSAGPVASQSPATQGGGASKAAPPAPDEGLGVGAHHLPVEQHARHVLWHLAH